RQVRGRVRQLPGREVAEGVDAADGRAEQHGRPRRVDRDVARAGDGELRIEVGDRCDVQADGVGGDGERDVDEAAVVQRIGRRRRAGLRVDDVARQLLDDEALRPAEVRDVRVGRALDVVRRERRRRERHDDLARRVRAGDVEAEDGGAGELRRRGARRDGDVAEAGAGELEVARRYRV